MLSPYSNPRGLPIPTYGRTPAPQTPALSEINAAQGPQAATGALFSRMADAVLSSDAQEQAAAAVDHATLVGQQDGDLAAGNGQAPVMKDDASLSGRAFNLAQTRAWQARMQIGLDQTSAQILTDHPDDPDKVAAKWGAATDGLKSTMPPAMAAQIGVLLDQRGATLVASAAGKLRQRQEGEANADLISGMTNASTQSANFWRDGQFLGPSGHDEDFRKYLFARTDLTPQAKMAQWLGYQQDRKRDAVLGEYGRAKEAGGLSGAKGFISSFVGGDHADLGPDSVARLGSEMAQDVRGLEAEHRVQVQELRGDASDAMFRMAHGYGAPNLGGLISRARALGDGDTARQLAELSGDAEGLARMAKMPLPDQTAHVAELEARARQSDDKASIVRAETARRMVGNISKSMTDDPLAYAAATGRAPVDKIDWSKPETMANRVRQSVKVWEYDQLPGAPQVLSKSDAADLTARLAGADAAGKAELLGKLYQGFGTKSLPQVLNAIQESNPDFAHAAAISAQGDSGVARDILRGGDIRASYEKKGSPGGRQYMPPNDDILARAFAAHLPHDALANMRPEDSAGVKSAILSSYAAKSFDKGLVSQAAVNPDLFKAAVKDITGGVVKWNGKSMVSPQRGLDQTGFDKLMAGLGDSDFSGARDVRGTAIPADMILRNASFEMIESGKYLVRLGGSYVADPWDKPYVADLGMRTLPDGGR